MGTKFGNKFRHIKAGVGCEGPNLQILPNFGTQTPSRGLSLHDFNEISRVSGQIRDRLTITVCWIWPRHYRVMGLKLDVFPTGFSAPCGKSMSDARTFRCARMVRTSSIITPGMVDWWAWTSASTGELATKVQ